MIVCIAEKPSVARDIANILGATQQHQGYLEGNGYQVTWTFGHLCELKYPEDYTPMWKRWSLGALPMIPTRFGIRLKNDKGVQTQFSVIEGLMKKAERIINCGDAGQEGELIQRWVMQKAGVTCPVDRLWISSLTEESIREGFSTLKPQADYKSLYEAGLCRAIGDWLLGMNATRLYTIKYGGGYGAPPLSIGRVQTPTLALIVRRQLEIDNFKPEPYWVLTTQYRDTVFNAIMADPNEDELPTENAEANEGDKKKQATAPTRRGFTSEEEGRTALEKIKTEPFVVTSVEKKRGTEQPPRLFDLTSLQVDCNRKFGYSADQTLSLIQALYEKKVTTYPRVDTTYLSDDIYPKCPGILKGIRAQYNDLLEPLRASNGQLLKRKKVFDSSKVTDHHAIIPTGVPANNLTDMERNVYDLVARRFITVFYPDCKFATTTVMGQAADVPFKTTGKLILEPGWRAVPPSAAKISSSSDDDDKKEEAERTLPDFVKGESGPHQPDLTQKMTQPPKLYTEATLLRAMETAGKMVDDEELRDAMKENGIGRPSTRAAIIETLFRRQYIRRQRKAIIATPTGIELISIIKEELLKSAELTGRWEKKLRQIEHHEYSATQFVDELKTMVSDIVTQVLRDNSARHISQTVDPIASLKAKANATATVQSSPTATAESKSTKPRRRIIRAGSVCPQCGIGKVIKGNTAYGCSRWKEGCNWRKPFK
ncbi:MAG: DNA topoisomerase 3 [Prevotella sp.]|nr:DNA topoisomerase 3 [Prevotella sp.]MDY5666578.1 DNA topoisomerase 3 [Alloprevotella sp.]